MGHPHHPPRQSKMVRVPLRHMHRRGGDERRSTNDAGPGGGDLGMLAEPRSQPYPPGRTSGLPAGPAIDQNTAGRSGGLREMPNEYRIGRLNGGFVVTWWEDGKRRRYRRAALSRKEAEAAAIGVIRKETVKAEAPTVKTIWELYRQEKTGRRIAAAMAFEWKAMGPHFGHLRPD